MAPTQLQVSTDQPLSTGWKAGREEVDMNVGSNDAEEESGKRDDRPSQNPRAARRRFPADRFSMPISFRSLAEERSDPGEDNEGKHRRDQHDQHHAPRQSVSRRSSIALENWPRVRELVHDLSGSVSSRGSDRKREVRCMACGNLKASGSRARHITIAAPL
jgi:hypothetical protein